MTVQELCCEARKRGLRLEPRGDKLAVIPAERVPPDFADLLRHHKRDLLDWLETKSVQMPADCVPWLHVARQVLAGEFAGCDGSTRQSLIFGLRSIGHPRCKQALAQLQPPTRQKP